MSCSGLYIRLTASHISCTHTCTILLYMNHNITSAEWMVRIEYGSGTTHGILHGIPIFQDILDNTCIFQDVDQDVLSEFQRSPCSKNGYKLVTPCFFLCYRISPGVVIHITPRPQGLTYTGRVWHAFTAIIG